MHILEPSTDPSEGFRQINDILEEAAIAAESTIRATSNITQITAVEKACKAIRAKKRLAPPAM